MTNLPDLLRQYRAARGLSQAGLAGHWQVPVSTIRGWEVGKRPAQPGMIAVLIGEALGNL